MSEVKPCSASRLPKDVRFSCANDESTEFRDRWYWRDDKCEESMGPFDSHAEALSDYRELRNLCSSDTGEKA
jgi:hypothetical protein